MLILKTKLNQAILNFVFAVLLCDGSSWFNHDDFSTTGALPRHFNHSIYSGVELAKMERALLIPLDGLCLREDDEEYEDMLFTGMCAALDVLKEIHRSRGENVDELPALTKRNLATV